MNFKEGPQFSKDFHTVKEGMIFKNSPFKSAHNLKMIHVFLKNNILFYKV